MSDHTEIRNLIAEARGASGSPSIGQMVPELCDEAEAVLGFLERLTKAADRVANWDEPRIVPTINCPDIGVAMRLLRSELAAVGGDPE